MTSVNVGDIIIKDNVGNKYYMDNPDFAPTRETPRADRVKELGRRVLALAGVVGALATPMLAEAAPAGDVTHDTEATALETAVRTPEVRLLAAMNSGENPLWNGGAEFKRGTKVRSRPDNNQASVIRVVGPTEMLLSEYFRLTQVRGKSGKNELWAVVSPPHKGVDHDQATDPKQNFWINLSSKSTQYTPLVYKNNNPDRSNRGVIDRTIKAGVDKNGNLWAVGKEGLIPHRRLATAVFLSKKSAVATLKHRGLVHSSFRIRYISPRLEQPPRVEQPQPLPSLPDLVPQPQGPIGGSVSPTPEVPPDAGPKRADQLPGFRDSEVSPEIKSKFDQSIVRVLIRRKGDGSWIDWCQGTKIDDEVFFAAHCEPTIGAPAHGDMPVGPNGVEAYDYANASEFEFTSVDPNLPNDIRLRADMQTAKEEGLVMPTGNDVAVLKLQPVNNPTFNTWQQQVGNQGHRSYSQISSMPYKVPTNTPTLGTQVYFNGASQYNGYRLLNNTVKQGISIGEWTDFSTWDIPQPRNMYVIATNPLSEAEDGGGFGTSGESAVTSKAELLISNSVRANYGYLNGPPNARESQDFFQRVVTEYETRGILLGKEQGSSTVLFFTKVTNDLKQKIDAAFGHAPPV